MSINISLCVNISCNSDLLLYKRVLLHFVEFTLEISDRMLVLRSLHSSIIFRAPKLEVYNISSSHLPLA